MKILTTIAAAGIMLVSANNLKGGPKLGVTDGQLKALPTSPNAVASYAAAAYPQSEPLRYTDEWTTARDRLITIIEAMPRASVETVTDDYIHVTFRSRLFRFVDDVEFLADDTQKIIDFRAAARTGYGDMGVNGKRMEEIRAAFE